MNIHYRDTTAPWPSVTFGFQRLWDTGTDWASLQPVRGVWDFTRLDALVALAQAHGVEVLLTLGLTPNWASSQPGLTTCAYGNGKCAPPADITDWQNYVQTVAQRYRGRIKYYEPWNEPDQSQFYVGTWAKMAELASVAYTTIKAADPNAIVLSPPLSGPPESWNEKFLAAGGGDTFDIFATHYYMDPPEASPPQIQALKDMLVKYGLQDKPMWDTEWGVCSLPGCLPAMPGAAAYVARHLILAASSGLARSAYYAWDNDARKLYDSKLNSPPFYQLNAMGVAYQTTTSWLIGSRLQTCVARSSEFWQCEIDRDGRRAWIVWNTVGTTAAQPSVLPAPIVETLALDGSPPNPVAPGAPINVGIAPMLLKTDTSPW